MVKIRVVYEGGLHCRSVHESSGSELATDAPKDNMGKGEGFSPTDLVATALVTCMLTTMGIYATRHSLVFEGASAEVEKEMAAAPLRRIARLGVRIQMPAGLTAEARQHLERVALGCPVQKSLGSDVERPVLFLYPDEPSI